VLLFEAPGEDVPVPVAVAVGEVVSSWVDVLVMLPVGVMLGLCTQDTVDTEKLSVRVGL